MILKSSHNVKILLQQKEHQYPFVKGYLLKENMKCLQTNLSDVGKDYAMQQGMLVKFFLSSFLTPSKLFKIFPNILEQTTILRYRNSSIQLQ